MGSRIVHAAGLAAIAALVAIGCTDPPNPIDPPERDLLTVSDGDLSATGGVLGAATNAQGDEVVFSTTSEIVDDEDPGSGTFVRDGVGEVKRISSDIGSMLWMSADGRWVTWTVQDPHLPGNSLIKVHDRSDDSTVEIARRYGTSVPAVVSETPEPTVVFGVFSTPEESYALCEVVVLATLESSPCPLPDMGPDATAGGIGAISSDGTQVVQRSLLPAAGAVAVANHVWDRETDQILTVFTQRYGYGTGISDDGRYLFGFDDLGPFMADLFPGAGGELRPDLGGSTPSTAGASSFVVATSPDGGFATVAGPAGADGSRPLHQWDLRASTPAGFGVTHPLGNAGAVGTSPVCSTGGFLTSDGGTCTLQMDGFDSIDANDSIDAYLTRP